MRRTALLLAVPILLATSACSKSYIPNTNVEDNTENRKVILFCEKYRHAVEDKDVYALLKLASPMYFEDGGNSKADDDYDFAGLKDYLNTTFVKTNGIRYEIRYRQITFATSGHVWVDYTYAAAYRIPGVTADEWKHKVADNRLDLVHDGDGYKIVSGM
jgi:hypothetical protein